MNYVYLVFGTHSPYNVWGCQIQKKPIQLYKNVTHKGAPSYSFEIYIAHYLNVWNKIHYKNPLRSPRVCFHLRITTNTKWRKLRRGGSSPWRSSWRSPPAGSGGVAALLSPLLRLFEQRRGKSRRRWSRRPHAGVKSPGSAPDQLAPR